MIEKENEILTTTTTAINGSNQDTTNGSSSDSPTKEEPSGEVDIILNNVVCNFSVRCHLNLKQIAQTGCNVEYHKAMAMLIMKFRRPRCTASIWSSGKITMTGATTETDAKIGARRCARVLQKLGFNVKFTNYRIVNVLATCTMPFAIRIADFASAHPRIASYEPELHPGVTYKMKDIKATLKIFSTGSVTITAPKVETVQTAVEEAYRLVYEYKNERRTEESEQLQLEKARKRLRAAAAAAEEELTVRKKRRNE